MESSHAEPVVPQTVLVIAATGGLGSRVTQQALKAGLSVHVLVRSAEKLHEVFSADTISALGKVNVGNATDGSVVSQALVGVDVVIECLGNNDRVEALNSIVMSVGAMPGDSQPAFVVLGGSPALLLNAEGAPATDSPRIAPMAGLARMHLATLSLLKTSRIARWTQVCPSRMSISPDRLPSGLFQARRDIIDLRVYEPGAPPLFYEDVADIMVRLVNIDKTEFFGHQVAIALK